MEKTREIDADEKVSQDLTKLSKKEQLLVNILMKDRNNFHVIHV